MRQNSVLYHLSNIEMEDRVYSPPDSRLLFAEGPRLMAESAALMALAPFLATVRRGDGHPVLFLPGFGGSDSSTAVLRSYVQSLGTLYSKTTNSVRLFLALPASVSLLSTGIENP